MGFAERNRRMGSYRRVITRPRLYTLGFFFFLFIIYHLTPYDSRLRSFIRFSGDTVEDYSQNRWPDDKWLFKPQKYPIDGDSEVGIIIKSGYGTRRRVPIALEAQSNETWFADTIVVTDYPQFEEHPVSYNLSNGATVPHVDIIGWNIERKVYGTKSHIERLSKYHHLSEAIEAEEWALSDGIGQAIGWEMDALKFVPALEYTWKTMPKKKWYIMADDDTYLLKASWLLILGFLDPSKPQFLGNPVGDYKGRFPHGGSSFAISGAAMSKLFDGHPDAVLEAHLESPQAVWGDKLLAETFMKVGIYLDETYKRFFNGENPWMTRMWIDRFCMPLVAFHGLGIGEAMVEASNVFKNWKDYPVFWRQLGRIFGAPDFASFKKEPIRVHVDFIGRLDEHSLTTNDVVSLEDCVRICGEHPTYCLAWTFDPPARQCHIAPWAIIGDWAEGRFSGINAALAEKTEGLCNTFPTS